MCLKIWWFLPVVWSHHHCHCQFLFYSHYQMLCGILFYSCSERILVIVCLFVNWRFISLWWVRFNLFLWIKLALSLFCHYLYWGIIFLERFVVGGVWRSEGLVEICEIIWWSYRVRGMKKINILRIKGLFDYWGFNIINENWRIAK